MASSSIGLPSCPELNPGSILESDKCNSLLGEGEKLTSSLFKEEPSPRDVVEPVDSKSKKMMPPQTSGQAMAIQVPSNLHQAPGVRSMKAIDHFRSLDTSDVMLSSLEPEDADEVPYFIQLYRPMIVKCVDCVPLLPQLRDIIDSQGERNKIKNTSKIDGPEAGMELFLKVLEKKVGHRDRWFRFVQAIKNADFEYVARVLEKQEIINTAIYTTQARLIDIFADVIYKKLKPSEIIVDLYSQRVLNKETFDAVRRDEEHNGESSATIILIDNIWRFHRNWFKIFLEALCKHDYKDIVKEIDPSFLEKREMKFKESSENSSDSMDVVEKDGDTYSKSSLSKREFSNNSLSPSKQESDKNSSIQENYLSETFEAPTSVNNLSGNSLQESLDIEVDQLTQNLDISLLEDSEQTDRKLLEDDGSLQSNNVSRRLEMTISDNRSLQSNTDNNMGSLAGVDSLAVMNVCQSLDREVESAVNRPNIIRSSMAESLLESNKQVNLDDSDEEERIGPVEELKLRSYQMELARPSLEGKNSVIVAPTGSGKTHVALYIIKHHMESINSIRHPKVIFLVEQSALAEQQGKQCMTYLPCNVKVITGESQRNERMKSLNEWIARRDLLVVTAQILLNALRDGIVSVTDFSLMVFDECHHTNDNHSYNMIMNRYLDIKLQDRERAKTLPMIVGMTASVGVGKATEDLKAKRHIEKVMANMDAEMIVTVTENIMELKKYVNIPKQKLYKVPKREKDHFGTLLHKLMDATEKYMKNSKYLEQVRKPETVLKPPLEKGSDQYTQWVSMLWRETAKIQDQVAGRFFDTCRKYLDLYNKALIIYKDARPSDALSFILKELRKWEQTVIPDETENKMRRMFDKTQSTLEKLIDDPKHRNPKLMALRRMIGDYFKENPDARVIVFVKTRELVKAIETYMKETEELRILNPIQFVGVQANKERGGMTKVEQDEILELFKEGNHKVIIATSVAEEGLDIQKCSLVVRYDHVTNEIAMVQSRGRGRAEDSKYVVLASEDSNTIRKEELNQMREIMMNRAIEKVRAELSTDKEAVLRRVREIQQAEKFARDIALKNRKAAQANLGEFKITCNPCRNFICMSTDIKKIENAHHAAINEDIMENVKVISSVPDFENDVISCGAGKVFCKKCGNPVGNVSIYKNAQFCILKCECLIMIDSAGNGITKKRWKQAPFMVPPLASSDLERRIQGEKYIEC